MWTPLLDGPLAQRALDTVDSIARALSDPGTLDTIDGEAGPETAATIDLAAGRAGIAVFYSYLAKSHSADYAQEATDHLDGAASGLAAITMSPSLFQGFTGIAWACSHLSDPDDEDESAEIDEALIQYLRQTPWTAEYDLVSGLVGIGVYALQQRPLPRADVMLSLVLDRLAEDATSTADGVTWQTPPALLPDDQRAVCPDGHANLGVAHGVPGVIALLGWACLTLHESKARPLLEGAVSWLLRQRLAEGAASVFPNWIASGVTPTPARLAWCYGDAGIAATLLVAARGAGRPDWEQEALMIARRAADRSIESTGVRDAGLCHGAAGLAHIFNRMYQATGEEWLAEAARRWFERTLAMSKPAGAITELEARQGDKSDSQREQDPGLLTGRAGIGLAMLAGCSTIEPAWDRMLLVSIPAGAESSADAT